MKLAPTKNPRAISAFTMIEIAICLAIISFALVAIIGVLPLGLNTQRDVREATIVNQDASVLLEAIRSGAQGSDFLTNYVYKITITNTVTTSNQNFSAAYLNSGKRIIGLLSTPGDNNDRAIAYVRSISGVAAEKPPQSATSAVFQDTFSYRLVCVNLQMPGGTPQLRNNLHELRMTFLWPLFPNGSTGNARQTFRTTIAGLMATNAGSPPLYFYQPQTYAP